MKFKVMHGDKLEALNAAMTANGLDLSEEYENGFSGLVGLREKMASDLRTEYAHEIAELGEAKAKAEAEAATAKEAQKAAEEKAEAVAAETIKAERDTPKIPAHAGEAPDHKSAWAAMPENTVAERKAKAAYYAEYINPNKGK